MNLEEQIRKSNELLRKMLSHTSQITDEENKQNLEEIEDIDESIEKYENEVKTLKEKLSNESNYKREKSDFEVNERPVVEELIMESISLEREDIFKSSTLYRRQQEQQTKMLGIYNNEIVKLKSEISTIEGRLKRDEIAKKRGIAKKLYLSDEEVSNLRDELEYKKQLIEDGKAAMEICSDEIRRFGRLITENNARLKSITEKEQRLLDIISSKQKIPKSDIDNYKIRLDQDELSKKLSALEALKNRKEYLLYNPSEEVLKQIKKNEEALKSIKKGASNENVTNEKENISSDIEEHKVDSEIEKWFEENQSNNQNGIKYAENVRKLFEKPVENESSEKHSEGNKEEKDNKEKLENNSKNEPVQEKNLKEDTSDEKENRALVKLDNDKKELIEMLDAPENLKKQKISDRIKNAWNKWRNKAITFVTATAITITSGMALSKNSDKEQLNKPIDSYVIEQKVIPEVENNSVAGLETSNSESKHDVENNISKVEAVSNVDKKDVQQPNSAAIDFTVSVNNQNYSIPEVEYDQNVSEIKEEQKNITNSEGAMKPDDSALNNQQSDIETEETILKSEGEFVEIPLANGDVVYVKYGDNSENVPKEITIKYIGTDMHVISPVMRVKSL